MQNTRMTQIGLLIGSLIWLTASSLPAQDLTPQVTPHVNSKVKPIDKGTRAPFTGILMDHGTAGRLGFRIEKLELRLLLEEDRCKETNESAQTLYSNILKIQTASITAQVSYLEDQVDTAKEETAEARSRPWYGKPEVWFSIGLTLGLVSGILAGL